MTKTNAMRMLDRAKIKYDVLQYDYDESDLSGVHAAAATPCFLTVKNCMRRLSTKNLPFCVKYVTGKLQLNSTDLEKQAAT